MNGEYLQVVVWQRNTEYVAASANGESLAKGSGCLAFFSGDSDMCPLSTDYFRYLDMQGWQFLSSNTTGIGSVLYTFTGGRGYKIRWEGDRWVGEENLPSDDYGADLENWWDL